MTIRTTHITSLRLLNYKNYLKVFERTAFHAIFKDVYGELSLSTILWANETSFEFFEPIRPSFEWMGSSWHSALMREINQIALEDALKNKPSTWL